MKNILNNVRKRLATMNINTSRWSAWVSDCVTYWKTEWWLGTKGLVAKSVKLAHDSLDYLSYYSIAWLGGLLCFVILF